MFFIFHLFARIAATGDLNPSLIASSGSDCSCGNLNPFNINGTLGYNKTFSNPITNYSCPSLQECVYQIPVDYIDNNVVLQIKINADQINNETDILGVFYCNDTQYNYFPNDTQKHAAMLSSGYPYTEFYTTEKFICVGYQSTMYLTNVSWTVEFRIVSTPPTLTIDNNIFQNSPIFWLDPYEDVNYLYTAFMPFQIYSVDIYLAFTLDEVHLDTNYCLGTGAYIAYDNYYKHFDGYVCNRFYHCCEGNIASVIKSSNFNHSFTGLIFRYNQIINNCVVTSTELAQTYKFMRYDRSFNDTVQTKPLKDIVNSNQCLYSIVIPKNQVNASKWSYLQIKSLYFESAYSSNVIVTTRTMNKTLILFEFNQDTMGMWKDVMIFGTVIAFDIPIASSLTVVGETVVGPNLTIVLDGANSKGLIMTPFFPEKTPSQAWLYTLECQSCQNMKIALTILFLDLPDWNSTLSFCASYSECQLILGGQLSNFSSYINQTRYFDQHTVVIGFSTTQPSEGMVIRFEAIENSNPVEEKKKPIALIIGVVIGVVLILASVFLGIYLWKRQKAKKRKKRIIYMSQRTTLQVVPTERPNASKPSIISDPWLIDEQYLRINFEEPIGTGFSATVYRGQLNGTSPLYNSINLISVKRFRDCKVAVKISKPTRQNDDNMILQELETMKIIGYNENIISLLGWCLFDGRSSLIFELADGGDLLIYAHKLRDEGKEIERNEALSFLYQISKGMEYIASKHLVHRDLAARNILLTTTKIAKISDFGLCCEIGENLTYQAGVVKKLPMKWLSIEALKERLFSEKSDVWAFGILMFEIFSRGQLPYMTLDVQEILEFLTSGNRLEKPQDASDEIYEVMLDCWKEEPRDRPTFQDLNRTFYRMIEDSGHSYGYLTYEDDENGAILDAQPQEVDPKPSCSNK